MRVRFPPIFVPCRALAFAAPPADTPSPALLVVNKEGSLAIVDPRFQRSGRHRPHRRQPARMRRFDRRQAGIRQQLRRRSTPGNTISVIDLVERRELRRVDLGVLRSPHGLAFAGGKLYFTAETNQVFGNLRPATNQVEWLQGTGQNTDPHDRGRQGI